MSTCTIILTTGARKGQLCERPCVNGTICKMHSNLVKENTTWDTLSKPKQKQFTKEIEDLIEKGTWKDNIFLLLKKYNLDQSITGDEVNCCVQAYRACHTRHSITFKHGMMYVSDLHKGHCIKVTQNVPELTVEAWNRLLEKLPKDTRKQFVEELIEINKRDVDALLYHYRISTTTFHWNDQALEIIMNSQE